MACGSRALDGDGDWARIQETSCQEHAGARILACLGTGPGTPGKLSFGNKTLKQGRKGLAVALGPQSGQGGSRHWTPRDGSDDSCNLHPLLRTRKCPGGWKTAGVPKSPVRNGQ